MLSTDNPSADLGDRIIQGAYFLIDFREEMGRGARAYGEAYKIFMEGEGVMPRFRAASEHLKSYRAFEKDLKKIRSNL